MWYVASSSTPVPSLFSEFMALELKMALIQGSHVLYMFIKRVLG